jgi:hypothetical protein
MSSFETDVMEDLYYDEAEGPARQQFDDYDDFGEEGDEFMRNIIGGIGRAVGGLVGGGDGFDEYDEFDEYDAYDEFEGDEMMDAMEEAVVDALAAEDSDEFMRRLRRGLMRARQIAQTVGRGVARVAPVVSRIASLIPHPAAQAIGRAAAVAGRIGRAISADEFDMMEDMYDLAEEYDDIDAAAPVIAGLAIRRTMPGVARLPRPARQQLVRSVTQATLNVARRQGPQAARAVPAVVRAVQTAVRQGRIPPRAAPQAIQRAAARVASNPQAARLAARAGTAARPAGAVSRRGGGTCPNCRQGGRRRQLRFRGPVTISIQGR